MNIYKFTQLDAEGQATAIEDYRREQRLYRLQYVNYGDAIEILIKDNERYRYNEEGIRL